jgi:hypothetical protein
LRRRACTGRTSANRPSCPSEATLPRGREFKPTAVTRRSFLRFARKTSRPAWCPTPPDRRDMHSRQDSHLRDRLPDAVWITSFALAFAGIARTDDPAAIGSPQGSRIGRRTRPFRRRGQGLVRECMTRRRCDLATLAEGPGSEALVRVLPRSATEIRRAARKSSQSAAESGSEKR